MSPLSKLRGGAKAPVAIFSNTISPEIAAIFTRVQEGKPAGNNTRKRWKPSRFRCAAGETKTLVILDEKITYAQAEHSVKHYSSEYKEGFMWQTERCIAATDACPICSMPKHNPTDKILVTVLDLTPYSYKDKDGNTVQKEYTKRELAIGTKQLPMFQSFASLNNGSLRGLVLNMTRGHEKLEVGTGVPSFNQVLTEEDLIESFGHEERKNDEGKVVVQENAAIYPFEYAKIHLPPTRSELATKYGVAPLPGSLEERVAESQADVVDEAPWENTVNMLDLTELPDID